MDNLNNSEIRLSTQEEIKFRDLTNKILNQQSQPDILSDSEKRDFFELLRKLGLTSQSEEDSFKINEILNIVIRSLSFLSIYILFVGIPVAIAWYQNISFLFIIYVILAATVLSVIFVGTLISKVSRGMAIIISIPFLVIGVWLFFILKNLG